MMMMRSDYYRSYLWTAVVFWIIIVAKARASGNSANTATTTAHQQQSSSSSSMSSYEAVRALDSYGDAVQLRHAQAAADVQGRLVIAMERGDELWIFSVPPNSGQQAVVMPHHHRKSKRRNGDDSSASAISSGMVQQLSLGGVISNSVLSGSTTSTTSTQSEKTTSTSVAAIVCTGIQADAVWLTRQLRAFCGSLWERYNTPNPSPLVISQAVAFAKRLFWGYPVDRQWKMPLMASVMKSGSDSGGSSRWARPMGLRTLVLSSNQTPRMQLVEPSGIIRPIEQHGIVCMGKNSEAVQTHIEEKLVPKLSQLNQKQTQNAIFDALRHVLGPNATPARILLEIVSSNGIDRQLISRT